MTLLQPGATPSSKLVASLGSPAAWPHPVSRIELIETHISWVLLTGDYAYKFKKPVDFGFLDFSTLDKRLHCCREEVRLNRRLAPQVYLDVVPVTGTPEQPRVGGEGEAIEYAVKMRQFDRHSGFDYLLAAGALDEGHMDKTAAMLADFQAEADIATGNAPYGSVAAVLAPIEENFAQVRPYLDTLAPASPLRERLARLQQWSVDRATLLGPAIERRRAEGYIREGHGDLHLRNIIDLDGDVVPFDCIEFNPGLRWIDVISELAFLLMDLDDHRHEHLSRRLLNAWLEHTGDYGGLELLRFYQVYRAMVRAKVASLRLAQSAAQATEAREFSDYVALAERYTAEHRPKLLITHGLSGSGKTWFTQRLLEDAPLIRLRSDIERKRLFGVDTADRQGGLSKGIYQPGASDRTYRHLRDTAANLLRWGFSVIVDAAFLERSQRDLFRSLARDARVPFAIVHCTADEATTRRRLRERQARGADASDAGVAVFEQQLRRAEPLSADELNVRFAADLAEVLGWIAPLPAAN